MRRALCLAGVCWLGTCALFQPLRAQQPAQAGSLIDAVRRRDDKAFAALLKAPPALSSTRQLGVAHMGHPVQSIVSIALRAVNPVLLHVNGLRAVQRAGH